MLFGLRCPVRDLLFVSTDEDAFAHWSIDTKKTFNWSAASPSLILLYMVMLRCRFFPCLQEG